MIESISERMSPCGFYKSSDLLSELPKEIMINVFDFLFYPEIHKCARTSKHIYAMVRSKDEAQLDLFKHHLLPIKILLDCPSFIQIDNSIHRNARLRNLLFELKNIEASGQIEDPLKIFDFSKDSNSYMHYKLRNTSISMIENSLKSPVQLPKKINDFFLSNLFVYSIARDPLLLDFILNVIAPSFLEKNILECIEEGTKSAFIHAVTLASVNAVTEKKIAQLQKVVSFVNSMDFPYFLNTVIVNESPEVTQKVLEAWLPMNGEFDLTTSICQCMKIFELKEGIDRKHLDVLFDSNSLIDLAGVIFYVVQQGNLGLNILIDLMTIRMVSGTMDREWGIYLLDTIIQKVFHNGDYIEIEEQIKIILNSSMPFSEEKLFKYIDLFNSVFACFSDDKIKIEEIAEMIKEKIDSLSKIPPAFAAIEEEEGAAAACSTSVFPVQIGVNIQQQFPLNGAALELIVTLDAPSLVDESSDVD